MLAHLPKPVAITLGVLAALIAFPVVWPAFMLFLMGDGSPLTSLFRFGLLVALTLGLRWVISGLRGNHTSLEPLRARGIAVAEAVPPLARTLAAGARQLFGMARRVFRYLRGCHWPRALGWFWLTLGIVILQAIPPIGFFIYFLGASLWSIVTINLGFAHLIVEPAMRNISPKWSLVGLAWFFGYAAISINGHVALDRLAAEVAAENSRQVLPFGPGTQSLVVVNGNSYGATSAERLLMTYALPVVYEERNDDGDAPRTRDSRPRFTAVRIGPPEFCDTITGNARLKAVVTRHSRMSFGGPSFCFYAATEAPELPVVRLQFSQEKLRIIGAEGEIDRITLTAEGDKRRNPLVEGASARLESVRAAPYQYLPLPYFSCFINSGWSRWECVPGFVKEGQRAHPDHLALVGKGLGLEPSSPGSRSAQIHGADPAALERAQNAAEAAAVAEFDRLLAHPVGSTAQLPMKILAARPDLIASRTERLAVAAAEALTTRDNGLDAHTWSDLMLALSDAEFRQVGPGFVDAVLTRWTKVSRSHYVYLGERLVYRLADLGPAALPLLERIYQADTRLESLAAIVALCRIGAPAADLTEKISPSQFSESRSHYDIEPREAIILAWMRQGRTDVADAWRLGHEQLVAAALRDRGYTLPSLSQPFEAKRRTMTPSSSPDDCMVTRR